MNDRNSELLRDTLVECDRRIKLNDFRGLFAVSGMVTGSVAAGDASALLLLNMIFGDDLNRNECFGGSGDVAVVPELFKFWGRVFDFSFNGDVVKFIRSVRFSMFDRLRDLPNDFMGVEDEPT